MTLRSHLLVILALTAFPFSAFAQTIEDFPPFYKGKPPTKKELDQRESLHHYVFGLLCERDDRLLEALKAYEKAAELDPEAPAVFKAQVALLLILERPNDAVTQAKKTLDLDPSDGEVSFVLARLYKGTGKYKEAIDVLEKAAVQPALKDSA